MEKKIFGINLTLQSKKFWVILPIIITIAISILLAQFTVSVLFSSNISLFDRTDQVAIATNVVIILLVSIFGLLFFFRLLKKKREIAIRFLVATFIISGVLAALLFIKLLFNALELEFPLILLVATIITYIGAYFGYLVIVDDLSCRMRNALFILCSGILGSFFGVLMPPSLIIVSLFILSVLDIILIKNKTVEKILGQITYEEILSEISFSNKEWGIGIGDLTCYSIVVANTAINFGIVFGALSLFLILVGSIVSLKIVFAKERLPGLPISIILGLLPAIIRIF